jgi:hypothetical protein
MIKNIKVLLFLITIQYITVFSSPLQTQNKIGLHIDFFGSVTCDECMRIKSELLQPLLEKHANNLNMTFYDIETDSGIKAIIGFEKKYKITTNASQLLCFPDTFLSGFDDIMEHGRSMIETRIGKVQFTTEKRNTLSDSIDIQNVLRSKTLRWGFFLGTLVTGLIDGINPCAIATMIFLISFLATKKRSRNEIIFIGIAYTATVFITYLAMGLGFKGILEHIKGYHIISTIIRWGACGLAVIVAIVSFRDAIVFHKSKNTEEIALQLPKAVKLRIHKIISGNLSKRNLLIGSVITGFLVTLLEAICTGQMYVPYIVAMTQQDSLRAVGYLYLIFYNFLFVLPLIIVMVLAYFGLKWTDLAKQTQKKMVLLKVLLGIIMTGLAIYLAVGSGFVG